MLKGQEIEIEVVKREERLSNFIQLRINLHKSLRLFVERFMTVITP